MLISTNTAKVRAVQRSRRRKKVATVTVGTCRLTNYLRVPTPDTLEALAFKGKDLLARGCFPHFDSLVSRGTGQALAVGAKGYAANFSCVSLETKNFLASV